MGRARTVGWLWMCEISVKSLPNSKNGEGIYLRSMQGWMPGARQYAVVG